MHRRFLKREIGVWNARGHLAQEGKLFDSTMHVGFLGVDGKEIFGRKIVCWYYALGKIGCEQE